MPLTSSYAQELVNLLKFDPRDQFNFDRFKELLLIFLALVMGMSILFAYVNFPEFRTGAILLGFFLTAWGIGWAITNANALPYAPIEYGSGNFPVEKFLLGFLLVWVMIFSKASIIQGYALPYASVATTPGNNVIATFFRVIAAPFSEELIFRSAFLPVGIFLLTQLVSFSFTVLLSSLAYFILVSFKVNPFLALAGSILAFILLTLSKTSAMASAVVTRFIDPIWLAFPAGVLVTSILFMGFHFFVYGGQETALRTVFFLGVVTSILTVGLKSIWSAIGFHFGLNLGVFLNLLG